MSEKEKLLIEVSKNWLKTLQAFEKDCPDGVGTSDKIILAGKVYEEPECECICPTAVPVTVEEARRLIYAEWKKETAKDKSNDRLLVAYKMAVERLEPRKNFLSIDDVMSVFDDFMCGDVDEDGMETFYEMLKDKCEER